MSSTHLKSIVSDLIAKNVMCGVIYSDPAPGSKELVIQFSEEDLDCLMGSISDSPACVEAFQAQVREIANGEVEW
jgi:hypothetical protein